MTPVAGPSPELEVIFSLKSSFHLLQQPLARTAAINCSVETRSLPLPQAHCKRHGFPPLTVFKADRLLHVGVFGVDNGGPLLQQGTPSHIFLFVLPSAVPVWVCLLPGPPYMPTMMRTQVKTYQSHPQSCFGEETVTAHFEYITQATSVSTCRCIQSYSINQVKGNVILAVSKQLTAAK